MSSETNRPKVVVGRSQGIAAIESSFFESSAAFGLSKETRKLLDRLAKLHGITPRAMIVKAIEEIAQRDLPAPRKRKTHNPES